MPYAGSHSKDLRDVEDTTGSPQSATIRLSRGGIAENFDWTAAGAAHPDLPSVSVFDSRSANVHVEKTNAVAYIPQPMQVLEALAIACDQVKRRLEARQAALRAQTPLALRNPSLGKETAAGSFIRSLSAKSSEAQLDLLAKLSEDEAKRLGTLQAD